MKHVTIGMIGLGTVGTGVARLLTEHADRIARRAGRKVRWTWAAVRDLEKPRDCRLDGVRLTTDVSEMIDDPEVDVIIETMGGTEPALEYVLAALAAGKHVVTANKALLAEHGATVFAQARARGRAVAFEASVGGRNPDRPGPGFRAGGQPGPEHRRHRQRHLQLHPDSDDREGLALRRGPAPGPGARLRRGRPDPGRRRHRHRPQAGDPGPTGVRDRASGSTQFHRQGIDRLHLADLKYAGELGYAIKLLALAKLSNDGLELRVAPTLVKHGTPLAEVRGPYNAIRVVGDAVGDTLFYGRGAGAMPTASAVVGDLIDVVTGRAALPTRVHEPLVRIRPRRSHSRPQAEIKSRYYLRFHDRRPARRAGQVGPDPG